MTARGDRRMTPELEVARRAMNYVRSHTALDPARAQRFLAELHHAATTWEGGSDRRAVIAALHIIEGPKA